MKAITLSDTSDRTSASIGLTCSRQTVLPTECVAYLTHIEINLIKSGAVTYLCGGNKIEVCGGRLVAFWAAIPHQIVSVTSDAEYFVMNIPLTWFLQCQFPEGFTRQILSGQVVVDPEECAPIDFDMFARWSDELQIHQPMRQRMVLLEVEAQLLRLVVRLGTPSCASQSQHGGEVLRGSENVERIRQMLCYIAQNYTDQITVALISRSVGFHPNYAMTLFRKTFGTTLVNYVTRHRVSHAQRLLATTDQKVVDVALSSGFNSLSRFNDAFKKQCGCSPREYRDRSRNVRFN